jgi:hypothetical protein
MEMELEVSTRIQLEIKLKQGKILFNKFKKKRSKQIL